MAADGPTSERIDGPTPNGGAYSVAHFLDAAGRPCPKSRAAAAEVHEFDGSGGPVFRTYLRRPDPPAVPPEVVAYLKLKSPAGP